MSLWRLTFVFALFFALNSSFVLAVEAPCLDPLLKALVQKNIYSESNHKFTNFRSWSEYKWTLGIRFSDQLFAKAPKTLIDLGAGTGVAVQGAVTSGFKEVVAIDLHRYNNVELTKKFFKNIIYEVGMAEEILLRYPNYASVIVDNYGAFTYSHARQHLLKQSYAALKKGGYAYIRWPPLNFVKIAGKDIPLEDYLIKKYPNNFSIRKTGKISPHENLDKIYTNTKNVLVMKKPSDEPLPLNLKIVKTSEWIQPPPEDVSLEKFVPAKFPILYYEELP